MQIENRQIMREIERRWARGDFRRRKVLAPILGLNVPCVRYEEYMLTWSARPIVGEPGLLQIEFPPETSEDNRMHIHPTAGRIVTALRGGGTFEFVRKGKLIRIRLKAGDEVVMPAGVLHTFRSGKQGLLVRSIHLPWLPLKHRRQLVYPKTEK